MRQAALLGFTLLLAGCFGGPREAELTVDIGPKLVTLDAKLHDLRISSADEALQAQTLARLVTADATKKTLEGAAKDVTATTWAWTVDGDSADLHIVASMPRDVFDACLVERAPNDNHSKFPCELVPLWKEQGELVADTQTWTRDGEVELHGPMRWPIGTTHLAGGWTWKKAFPQQPGKVLARVLKDPSGYGKVLPQIVLYSEALQAGDATKARRLITNPPMMGDARALLFELATRERLQLLRGLLESQQLPPPAQAPQIGPSFIVTAWQQFADVIPKSSAPHQQMLELSLLYDRAAAEPLQKLAWRSELQPGTSEWARANEDVHVSFSETELASQCVKIVKAKPAFKKLCVLLTESGPRS